MATVSEFMKGDHADCDTLFVEVESAAGSGDWDRTQAAWDRFATAMHRHFAREEDVLFPAFEERSGMVDGPTAIMRQDHDQMRQLMGTLADSLAQRDSGSFLGLAEVMMVMIQQHNMKEEQVLYPMADDVLTDREEVVGRMQDLAEPPAEG